MDLLVNSAMFNPSPDVLKKILNLLFDQQEISMLLKGIMLCEGFTLLGRSIINNIEVMKFLIESGADVNARSEDGRIALMIAASGFYTKKERVELLINAGADVMLKDEKGKSALDYANENKSLDQAEKEGIIDLLTKTAKKAETP